MRHSPPTACRRRGFRFTNLPFRGSSQLSVALLSSLSVTREYLALEGGPPRFGPGSTCQALLGSRPQGGQTFSRTGLSPSVAPLSSRIPLRFAFVTPRPEGPGLSHDPGRMTPTGLGWSPFARRY